MKNRNQLTLKWNGYFEENGIAWKIMSIFLFLVANVMCLKMASHEVFWYDEAYTVGMVIRDFKDIVSITANDVHSPFYYFVLKAFYMTAGMKSLISTKIFSWIFFSAYLIFGGGYMPKAF